MTEAHLEQGSKEWLEMRKSHIGGSNISCITGNNPWKSAYTLWLEQTGRKEADPINAAMRHGLDTEKEALETYIENTGYLMLLKPPTLFYDKWPVAMASLDGITQDKSIICEIKCPLSSTLYEKALDKHIPAYYRDQMQWQLMITGAKRCDFFVYVNNFQNVTIPVLPDKEYQEDLLAKAVSYWAFVVKDEAPPNPNEFEAIDDSFSNELVMHWKVYKEQQEEATKNMKDIEEQLKDLHKDQKCFFPSAKVKMNWIVRKGNVNWKKVCNDNHIPEETLEKYRNKASKYFTLSIVE